MMRPNPWSREDMRELIKLYPTTGIEVLMQKFGRSYRSIIMKAHSLQVQRPVELRAAMGKCTQLKFVGPRKPRKVWTAAVVKQLLAEYPHTPNNVLAQKYGVSARAICCLANRMDVKKSSVHLSAMGAVSNAHRWNKV